MAESHRVIENFSVSFFCPNEGRRRHVLRMMFALLCDIVYKEGRGGGVLM